MPNIYKVFLKEVNRVDGKDVDINTFVGEKGEIFFDIDNNRLRVSDGSTAGGVDLESNATGINTTGTSYFTNVNISGSTVAGIATFSDIAVRNINATGITTYEDVRNVDSIGIVTARQGLKVTGGDLNVGTAATIYSDGNASVGVITASKFAGDGSLLTSLNADNISSGIVTSAQLGGGSASATTYLQGNGQWATINASGLTNSGASRNFWHYQTSSSWSTNNTSFTDTNIALDCGSMTSDGFLLVTFTEGRREHDWNQTGGRHLYTINNGSSWEIFGYTDGNHDRSNSNLPENNEYRVYQGTYVLTVANNNHVKFKIQGRRYGSSNQYFLNNTSGQHSGICAIKIAS